MRPWKIWVLLACFGCQERPAAAAPKPPAPKAPKTDDALPHGRASFQSRTGSVVFDVELALDAPTHAKGLMFRKEVPEGTGMLFVFDDETPRTFWMKNTLVPLDMLFLSSSHKVVAIAENAEPLTTTPRDSVAPAKYVLELAGGTAFAKGIRVGDVASFEGVP